MKKSHFYNIVLVLFFHVTVCFTQNQNANGFVWVIHGKNNSVFLAGSLHLLSENNYPLPAAFEAAYDASDIIVFEMHPESLQTPAAQKRMINIARYPAGDDLRKSLDDTVLLRLQEVCASLSLNPHQLYPFKPWFVSMSLTMAQLHLLGYNSQNGIDHYFFNKARKDRKRILGLESFSYQMQLFADLSDAQQEDLLQQTFSQLFTLKTDLDSIIGAWYTADLKSLERTLTKSFYDYPHLADKFIVQRNKNWIKHIISYLDKKENFLVIVGSGHFPGRNGLLQLLENEGLNPVRPSERIKNDD